MKFERNPKTPKNALNHRQIRIGSAEQNSNVAKLIIVSAYEAFDLTRNHFHLTRKSCGFKNLNGKIFLVIASLQNGRGDLHAVIPACLKRGSRNNGFPQFDRLTAPSEAEGLSRE